MAHAELLFDASGNIATDGSGNTRFVACLPPTMDPKTTLTGSTLSFELNLHAGCIETDIGPIPIEEYELDVERYPDNWLDLIRDQIHFFGASLEDAIAIYVYDVESPKKYDPTTERKSVEIGGAFRVTLRGKPANKEYGVDYYPPYLLYNPNDWQ